MIFRRGVTVLLITVVAAIGCGGGGPQDAAATPDETPIQLAQATPDASASGGGSGSITGVVQFQGTAPQQKRIQMAADPACALQHTEPVYADAVVVNDNGTLRNVFVYLKEGVAGSYPTPSEPVTLNQAGCAYIPHVAGIQVSQPLQIINSDATLHNVNAQPSTNRPFNIAQPVQGMKTSKKFTKPEVMVRFKCNVHPWMRAYLGVVSHPFFSVSGADGTFTINGLPDGTYVLEAWHETYGTQTQSVTVSGGSSPSVELAFSAQ